MTLGMLLKNTFHCVGTEECLAFSELVFGIIGIVSEQVWFVCFFFSS